MFAMLACVQSRGMRACCDGGVFGGQAEGVPAHGVQHVEAAHPLIARERVADGVVADVADVERAARIGQHFQHVDIWAWRGSPRPVEGGVLPALVPLQFDLFVVVRLFRHSVGRKHAPRLEGLPGGRRREAGSFGWSRDAAKPYRTNIRGVMGGLCWRASAMGGWLHTRRGGGSGRRDFLCAVVDFFVRAGVEMKFAKRSQLRFVALTGGFRLNRRANLRRHVEITSIKRLQRGARLGSIRWLKLAELRTFASAVNR